MKKALITGITGQDGYFLSRLLLNKDYEVHGLIRRSSQNSIGNLKYLPQTEREKIIIHWGDITDHTVIDTLIRAGCFDEIYHLAAQSFVSFSFTNPRSTYDINIRGSENIIKSVKEFSERQGPTDINIMGTYNFTDAINRFVPSTKLYFAATSELFGKAKESPQNEETPFYPRSPYAISKLAGFWTVKNYREAYNLFMSNGILFNHESEIRGPEFVTRKITQAAARIKLGLQDLFEIGNLNVKRDWGYSGDYVEAMWRILQYEKPDDFVIATGINHTIREFIEAAFKILDIEIVWEGKGVNEVGKDRTSSKVLVKVNPKYFRPSDVENILGDYSKAREKLGWQPRVKFQELVERMVRADLKRLGRR